MDAVTLQIRTRLFWALYIRDITFAYNQGRPPLIRLSECSIVLPVAVDNEYIKKTEILPQPESNSPLAIAAAVTTIEIYIILEHVWFPFSLNNVVVLNLNHRSCRLSMRHRGRQQMRMIYTTHGPVEAIS
ncbi:uncharacterized protein B0I36DRAFT_48499 [Microdochium trichocladiopsis]|uniref:Xylanolytic transcriptional activator regulatory domain-containing protein n=1 Tax=Microdochium trichocladiopsis TaxID=1682393 RepID=A0A9P8XRP9_9PEZI|nr:uncharacterized protein B0I36DRAFT_48499 [Microdochium trichocladiopsis]KAH7014183.1 hypothetical protein B0I36DRAFT_48499 [Microdochium trichocladiopsis]